VVTTTASDAHTWNLVYLRLLIEEHGYRVTNLGPCVPDHLLVRTCRAVRPDLVVVSSVNGHGCRDGLRLIGRLRACPSLLATPVVIGGKLSTADVLPAEREAELVRAGYDAVFQNDTGAERFGQFLAALPVGVAG